MQFLGLKPGQGGYRVLFMSLVLLIVLGPLIKEFSERNWLMSLLFTVVMLASVWVVSQNKKNLAVVALLAFIAVGGEWTRLAEMNLSAEVPDLATMAAFTWVAVVMANDVFRDREFVSADMIFGAINVYLLATLAFAAAYQLQVSLVPDSINGLGESSTFADALYFSAVTITTLGYGDITPVSNAARMLAYVEALFGQLFIAVVLAKLVASHLAGRGRGTSNPD